MKMNTEERLATVSEMYPPTITELLDIATSSHQKVQHQNPTLPNLLLIAHLSVYAGFLCGCGSGTVPAISV